MEMIGDKIHSLCSVIKMQSKANLRLLHWTLLFAVVYIWAVVGLSLIPLVGTHTLVWHVYHYPWPRDFKAMFVSLSVKSMSICALYWTISKNYIKFIRYTCNASCNSIQQPCNNLLLFYNCFWFSLALSESCLNTNSRLLIYMMWPLIFHFTLL